MRKGYRLQVTGYSLLLFILLSTVACTLYPAYAADSTPSADIKSKLEELKKEIASKAAKIKQEVGHKLKDKAYVGKVKSKSDTTLTLAAQSGPKMVSINQDTFFESSIKSKQKFSQKTVSAEDYIAALGDADETGVLTARKIILLPAKNSQPKTYFWGQVISISDRLITLRNNEYKNVAATLPAGFEVSQSDFVILTGSKNKNDIFEAGFVFVIPQGGILKSKKIVYPERSQGATPSVKIATPSAKKVYPTPKSAGATPSAKPAAKKPN